MARPRHYSPHISRFQALVVRGDSDLKLNRSQSVLENHERSEENLENYHRRRIISPAFSVQRNSVYFVHLDWGAILYCPPYGRGWHVRLLGHCKGALSSSSRRHG